MDVSFCHLGKKKKKKIFLKDVSVKYLITNLPNQVSYLSASAGQEAWAAGTTRERDDDDDDTGRGRLLARQAFTLCQARHCGLLSRVLRLQGQGRQSVLFKYLRTYWYFGLGTEKSTDTPSRPSCFKEAKAQGRLAAASQTPQAYGSRARARTRMGHTGGSRH